MDRPDFDVRKLRQPDAVDWREYADYLEAELDKLKNGYQGGCYACEIVGEKNVALSDELAEANEIAQKRIAELKAELSMRCVEEWRLNMENQRLREVEKYARIFVDDSYRPAPKYDAMRYDDLKRALAALLEEEE